MLKQESVDGNILAPRGESLDDNSNARPMLAIVPLFCTSSPRFTHASSWKQNYVPCASCASIPHGRFAEVVALITDLQGRKIPRYCARGSTFRAHEMKRRKRLVRLKRVPLPLRGSYFIDLRDLANA